jgi:hypothetical protein
MLDVLILVLGYAVLGASVKYGDDAFDRKVFSQKKAVLLAPFVSVLWVYFMLTSAASATILGSIVLGVFLTDKIDWKAFQLGLLIIGLLSISFFINHWMNFLFVPLIGLTVAGVLDEIGNDFVDKKKKANQFVKHFFRHRFMLKLGVLLFSLLGFYGLEFVVAFLAWDVGYDEMGFISKTYFSKK